MQKFDFDSRKQDKQQLYDQLLLAGAKPYKNNTFCCPYHNDKSPSAGIKKGTKGWFFHCFVCGISYDVWDVEAKLKGVSLSELVKEQTGSNQTTAKWQYLYPSINDLLAAIDSVNIEEVNKYTDPDTGKLDLITIRYIPRGETRKKFIQAHETDKGIVPKRPAGLLPLFNRLRLKDAEIVIYVEGEGKVRKLHDLGFVATTGAGGSKNADAHDYSPLSGKRVVIWPDNDEPGKRYAEQVRDKLLELENPPEVFGVDISGLDLPETGDVKDLCEKILSEGGSEQDCKDCIASLVEDASEINRLQCLEDLLDDMRDGKYTNFPIADFPILTNEAKLLLNKRIGIIFGVEGFGKTLFAGKMCDDLLLSGHKVARLQLEDEMEQHLLRSFAQQSLRAELADDGWHKENPDASRVLYEQFKATLDEIAPSIIAGEHENWDEEKILKWIESQLKSGKELIVIDPISVIMSDRIWITSHRLMWATKKILAKYPNGRVIFISHPNDEGHVAGGKAFRRFSHCMLMLNRYKKPKSCEVIDINGELKVMEVGASIGIVKTRYGRGANLEIAVELDSSTLKMKEIGIIARELKDRKPVGRQFGDEEDVEL